MKKPNITPGPWNKKGHHILADRNGEDGTKVAYSFQDGPMEEWEPNARLIAAAPQMAEALNDLAAAFETLWRITCKDHPNETLEAAKTALLAAGYTE